MIERVRPSSGASSSQPRVRGRPFQHGNPGRPPGSKNKVTRFLEELVENEGEMLTRKLIDLAKTGNPRSLLYCMDRLLPQRRGQPINLELPKIDRVQDVAPAIAAGGPRGCGYASGTRRRVRASPARHGNEHKSG